MNRIQIVCCTILILGSLHVSALAVGPTPEEMTLVKEWTLTHLGPQAKTLPFSFAYNKVVPQDITSWKREQSAKKLDDFRTQNTITWTDPQTALQVRCVVVEYNDFPTVEWTVYFKNTGAVDSPFLDDIRALDTTLNRDPDPRGQFLLHHHRGSFANRSDYMPLESPLPVFGWEKISASQGDGRPCDSDWPYFNVEWNGGKEGMIVVVGWPGQWSSEWKADAATGLRVTAGQEMTHFKLRPGEEVRTPLIVLQRWKGGNWYDAQNVWRRWMIKHNLPRPGGKLPKPLLALSITGFDIFFWMYGANAADNKSYIDYYVEKGLKPDYFLMETGWQIEPPVKWEPDTKRFPNGIKEISDHAHSKGIKTILWFEPERVVPPSWTTQEHPEWCLASSKHPHMLLDLGNPKAMQWMTDNISERLSKDKIDVFRSDFNIGPLPHWRQNDSPDRQGILENHWCSGYLAFWDELLRRDPNLLIDSCASGGRRNDLESLRRSIILWRSDFAGGPSEMQCQTFGISLWIPYHGSILGNSGVFGSMKFDYTMNPYIFRSCMYPSIVAWFDKKREKEIDYPLIRKLLDQWRQVAPYYFGDFYPLTPYNLYDDVWMAWQFDVPESGEGVIQAFRRPGSTVATQRLLLRGLKPDVKYEVVDFDDLVKNRFSGQELMEKGLEIQIKDASGAKVITYKAESLAKFQNMYNLPVTPSPQK